LVGAAERRDERGNVSARTCVQLGKRGASGCREREVDLASVGGRAGALYQSSANEPPDEPAHVAGVEVEVAHECCCSRRVAVRQLEQQAAFGERVRAVEITLVERSDDTRVEAAEPADGVYCRCGSGLTWHTIALKEMVANVN
jgi:hypothetical protein